MSFRAFPFPLCPLPFPSPGRPSSVGRSRPRPSEDSPIGLDPKDSGEEVAFPMEHGHMPARAYCNRRVETHENRQDFQVTFPRHYQQRSCRRLREMRALVSKAGMESAGLTSQSGRLGGVSTGSGG